MRLSKPDPESPGKRRHFEISIDSPFHILSCQAGLANTTLPAYSAPDGSLSAQPLGVCGCPGARLRQPSTSFFPQSGPTSSAVHVASTPATDESVSNPDGARPMHLIRNPSFNPPPFDEDTPPPLITPPPQYDSVFENRGLADYFARLADEVGDEEDEEHSMGRSRMDLPLTPGARVNRSMDAQRTWQPLERH